MEKLPIGLKIEHSPNPVRASLSGKSTVRKKYTWWFRTTVTAINSDVRITEFGVYAWHKGQWVLGNYSGKPFSQTEFAEWYACPAAVVKKGKRFSDASNWGSAPELVAGKALWYYIGTDLEGRRVKGASIVEQKGEIDPKRTDDAAFRKESQTPGSVDLFNGKDLSGWVVEGTAQCKDGQPVWTADDGRIICNGQGYGFLRYDRKVRDFALMLDFRMDRHVNSGVGIRHGKFTGDRESRPSFAGYEIQLLDDANSAASKTSSGSLYRYVAPQAQAMKPAGEWNKMVIKCRGPQIIVKLNDVLIHELSQSELEEIATKPLSGYVSLQNHGGKIEFRNIRLDALD